MAYIPNLADAQDAINEAQTDAQPQTNPALAPRIGADVLSGLAQFGHGLINTPSNLANTLAKYGVINQSSASMVPRQQDYNYAQMLGINNPSIGDKLLQGATQFAPYMALPGGALAQGAAYGATQSTNPITGAALGSTLGKASELLPAAISAIGKVANAVRPQKAAQQIMDNLSGGGSLEDNAQSLASDLRNAYQQQVANGQAKYTALFNQFGNNPIYNRIAPIFGTSQKGAYENIANDARQNYGGDLKDLHDAFISNPTLNNAHQLQSQLGAEIGSMKYANAKGALDQAGQNTLTSYQKARGALLNDINSYLGSQGLDAVGAYRSATNNWQTNIAPYLADSNLAQIAKGEITNPTYSQINSIFKNPEPEIQKVVSDVGPQANNKILFNELGKNQNKLTPENITNSFNQLDNKGLSSYVTPDLEQQMAQLGGKIKGRDLAQRIGGITAGTVLGAKLGLPYAETIGAGLGYAAAPFASRLSNMAPSMRFPLTTALLNAAQKSYRPLSNTANANIINAIEGQK